MEKWTIEHLNLLLNITMIVVVLGVGWRLSSLLHELQQILTGLVNGIKL
jgi:hypothetical protein